MKSHSLSALALALAGSASAILKPYEQCGGVGYDGDTLCPAMHTCVVINSYYSSCISADHYPSVSDSYKPRPTSPQYNHCKDPSKPCQEDSYQQPIDAPDLYQAYTTSPHKPYTADRYKTYRRGRARASESPYKHCEDPDKPCRHGLYRTDSYKPYSTHSPPPEYTSETHISNLRHMNLKRGPDDETTTGGNTTPIGTTLLPQSTGGFTPVVGGTTIETRRPIEELQATYQDEYNMFILGLAAFEAEDESLDLSYYQISGIHGRPHIPWQSPVDPLTQDPTRGYCTHGSALFPTWHRPYLILVEQTLLRHAINIASRFTGPEAQKYQDAATKVRIPFWDWSSQVTRSRIPAALTSPLVDVIEPGPDGAPTPRSIANPLFTYKFTNDQYRQIYFAGSFRNMDSTRRQPDGSFNSRNALAEQEMTNTYDSRRANTYNLFSIPSFTQFSSTAARGSSPPSNWISVEAIHNNIHSHIGGASGHMSWVDYAGFDPIFWLHHCNIDRLTAMFQAVRPGDFVQPGPPSRTFGRRVQPGDRDDVNTPLLPFRHPNGQAWTSQDINSAGSIFTYGYAYPEIPLEYRDKPASDLTDFVIGKVNELYRPDLSGGNASSGTRRRARGSPGPGPAKSRREWIVHIEMDQGEVIGQFSVLVFLGDLPAAVGDWQTAPDHVGDCSTFGDEESTMRHIIRATVVLTEALLEKKVDLDPSNSVPYLRNHLQWVVQRGDQSIPASSLKSLRLGVTSALVDYPANFGELPKWGKQETHYDITHERPGGLQYNESYLVGTDPAPPVISNDSIYGGSPPPKFAKLKF